MMYAASSQRSTVRIQRQNSSRESKRTGYRPNSASSARPDSAASSARPNIANRFQSVKRPSTPYKSISNSLERIRRSQTTFKLTNDDLQQFHRAFCYMAKKGALESLAPSTSKRDRQKKKPNTSNPTNTVERPWEEKDAAKMTLSLSNFFETFQLSHTSNGGFLDGIFDLVGTKDLHAMTFGEFLDGVCTFGMFKLDDMIKFVFFIMDKEKKGHIARFQLLRFVESLHTKKILVFEQVILPKGDGSKNADKLRLPGAERQKSSVDFDTVTKLCMVYPTMFEPMLLFQNTLRRRIMGEVWWKRKENEIEKYFRTLDQTREKMRRKEEKRLFKERKEKIISDVGRLPYYLRRKARSEVEMEYPKPIVSLEEETGAISVKWTRTDGEGDDQAEVAETA